MLARHLGRRIDLCLLLRQSRIACDFRFCLGRAPIGTSSSEAPLHRPSIAAETAADLWETCASPPRLAHPVELGAFDPTPVPLSVRIGDLAGLGVA